MWLAKGEKTRIRRLEREDVDKMQLWSKHRDPLFFHYNFPRLNKEESDAWYREKTKRWKKKSFVIENLQGEVIGYLSIRNIKWIKKESELGIVLNPGYMNQGLGTDAITAFLHYYFTELKMSSLILRAAKFNERAIRCYLHCGFQKIGENDFEFEDQSTKIFSKPEYQEYESFFIRKDQRILTRYVLMEITKQDFTHKINSISTKITEKCE